MIKRFVLTAFALILALTAFCPAAGAEGEYLKLEAVSSEGLLSVRLVAASSLEFGGVSGSFEYDESAFALVYARGGLLSPIVNVEGRIFAADTGDVIVTEGGETLFELVFKPTDGFSESKEYAFTLELESAYDPELEEYPWSVGLHIGTAVKGAELPQEAPAASETAPAQLPTDAPGAAEEHTVVFTDQDGRALAILTVAHGEEISPADLPEGCDHWAFGEDEFDFSQPVYGDLTLRAAAKAEETPAPSAPPSETEAPVEEGDGDAPRGSGALPYLIGAGAALAAGACAFAIIKRKKKN